MNKICDWCGKEKGLNAVRFGVCFQCADIESIILEGLDMWDKGVPNAVGGGTRAAETAAEKVKLLHMRGYIKN